MSPERFLCPRSVSDLRGQGEKVPKFQISAPEWWAGLCSHVGQAVLRGAPMGAGGSTAWVMLWSAGMR